MIMKILETAIKELSSEGETTLDSYRIFSGTELKNRGYLIPTIVYRLMYVDGRVWDLSATNAPEAILEAIEKCLFKNVNSKVKIK